MSSAVPQIGKFGNTFRMLSTTIPRNAIYDVDTEKDFNDKALNCKKPVIVDFHARYVLANNLQQLQIELDFLVVN